MAAVPALFRMRDENGVLEAGAKLYTYIAGTTTPLAVYSDAALSTPFPNPAIADAFGRIVVWFDSNQSYKVEVKKSDDSADLFPAFDNYSPGDDDILQFVGTDASAAAVAAAEAAALAEGYKDDAETAANTATAAASAVTADAITASAAAAGASTSETNAATSEANAASSESNAAASALAADADATSAAGSATSAGTSETNAAASDDSAELHDISAGLSNENIRSRVLPGSYANAAAAAADENAIVGSQYLGTDDGYYALTALSPAAAIAVPSLTAQQTTNLAAVPRIDEFTARLDDSGISAGAADAYVYTSASGLELSAYAAGVKVAFFAAATNTGASTINIDGLGVKDLRKRFNTPLIAGDIPLGLRVEAVYDATNDVFQIVSPLVNNNLTALEALTGAAADKMPYFTGAGAMNVADFTSFGRTLAGSANAAAAQASLNLDPGSDVQAYSARLTAIAAIAATNSRFLVGNGSTWVAETGSTARASMGAGEVNTYTSGNPALLRIKTNGNDVGITWGSDTVNAGQSFIQNFISSFSGVPIGLITGTSANSNLDKNLTAVTSTSNITLRNWTADNQLIMWAAIGQLP